MTKSKSSNALQTGIGIKESLYKSKAALPNEHQVNAKMYSDIGDQFSAPGDRPRGILRNIGAGLAKGAAAGEMTKDVAKKNKDYDAFAEGMEYFQAANNAAVERNEWFEKREAARQEYLPQVIAYADNIDKLDPQSLRIMAEGILSGYGKSIGENFRLSSIDGTNPFLMTVESDKGQQLFDVRSMFAGDEVMQSQLAMKMPEFLAKQQEERQNKKKEFELKGRALDIQEKSIESKNEIAQAKNDQNAAKINMKLNETLGKKIDASKEFLTIAPKMEQIVKDHPDIFQSAMDVVWREQEKPGYFNTFIKDMQKKMSPDKVDALTKMYKYVNKMVIDVAQGFSRPNMFIEKIGSKAVPNLDMTPQAFLDVLGEMREENRNSIKNNLARAKILEQDNTQLSRQFEDSSSSVMGSNNQNVPSQDQWSSLGNPSS
jgi:hypothetical protein